MKVVVIGARGQLGTELCRILAPESLVPLTHADIEITNREQVREVLASHKPDVVINAAAYNVVDRCETEPEQAFSVNAIGAYNVAVACGEAGATLVHYSTDYVFSGESGRPYTEDDCPLPINVYGSSKLAGERLVAVAVEKLFLIRTSGLYGHAGSRAKGGNFVEKMLSLARQGREIHVVDDQRVSPTYAVDLARKTVELIGTDRYGLYHVVNRGECSWHEFALEVFRLAGLKPSLSKTTQRGLGLLARRPAYSVLANARLGRLGLDDLRPWKEALAEYLLTHNRV